MLYTADETRIVATPCTVTEYAIPDGVTIINWAFYKRHNLQKITVPASVSDMNHAFNSCDKLTDVILSEGLKAVKSYGFSDNTALESITLPESLETFGFAVFSGCDSLREVVLPKSVTKADSYALGACNEIARVTFLNPACEIDDKFFISPTTGHPTVPFEGVIVGYDDSTAEKFANDNGYTFESLGKIFGYLVYKKYEDQIKIVGHTDELPADAEIPDSIEELPVTVIAESAFKKSMVLETIKLPDTLTEIGVNAFDYCTNLKEITFPASLKTVAYGAFYGCSAITELVIPDTVEYVDAFAFADCTQLKKLTLGAETVDDYCFENCTALEDVTITASVKTIVGAFASCDSLKELVIPDTVDSAFCPVCDCSALEKLTIGARQLGGTSNEYYIVNILPALKELILTDHVEELNVGMANVNISTLEIPASVKTINAVFCCDCDNLMTDGSLIIRSKDCEFAEKALFDEFVGNKFGGTVYGYPGSTAETYCKDNEIKFVPICNVTFDANGAEGSMDGGEFFGEITLPENAFTVPEGKVFTGWLLTGDDTLHAAGETVTLTDDTVITAQWETLTYTVKFTANGGSGTMSPLTVEYGAKVTLPVCSFTAPEGKQFSGWQIGTKTYQPGKEITVKADKTVKALWEDEVTFTLTFNPNGSTGTMDPITVKQGESLTLPAFGFPVPSNMQFSRWMVDGNLYVPGSEITLTADAEANPVWEPIPFTVMFDANGGTGTMDDVIVPGGSSFNLPECGFTAPSGKQFAGWQIKDDVSMTYQPAQTLTVTADLTLIPVWKDSEEKLMGDVNGDGLVDSADAMLVSRYVNAWPDIVIDMQTADLDGSGTVDNADAMILARYVNGWTGYDSYIVTVSG